MKPTSIILCLLLSGAVFAQTPRTGIFERSTDIGNPAIKGEVLYNASNQSYSLKGSGYNIWFERDEFSYAFNQIEGDFILTANFRFEGAGGDAHRKTGWMVRASEDESSPHISAVLHGDGLTAMQWRDFSGGEQHPPEELPMLGPPRRRRSPGPGAAR